MAKKLQKGTFEDVSIKLSEDKSKIVGKYNKVLKVFKYTLSKDTDFNNKYKGWGLDEGVLNFLVQQNATIALHDNTLKWDYEAKASDFKFYGELVEPKWEGARAIRYLNVEHWTITKIKGRSQILKCKCDCRYNFNNICIRGAITLNEEGECEGFEDNN